MSTGDAPWREWKGSYEGTKATVLYTTVYDGRNIEWAPLNVPNVDTGVEGYFLVTGLVIETSQPDQLPWPIILAWLLSHNQRQQKLTPLRQRIPRPPEITHGS